MIEPVSLSERKVLAKAVTRLLGEWQLSEEACVGLLGMTGDAHARLRAYARGEPLEDDPGLLQRVGYLLSIYRLLGVLYPENAEIRAQWMRSRSRRFEGDTPADIGRRDGLRGWKGFRWSSPGCVAVNRCLVEADFATLRENPRRV